MPVPRGRNRSGVDPPPLLQPRLPHGLQLDGGGGGQHSPSPQRSNQGGPLRGGAVGQVWTRHCRSSRACPVAVIAFSVLSVLSLPLAQSLPPRLGSGPWAHGFWALRPDPTLHESEPGSWRLFRVPCLGCLYFGCAYCCWPLWATLPALIGPSTEGGREEWQPGLLCLTPPLPLCDIPSGCCLFTGPWTVTRSSLRMLRRVAAFCQPLRPVLLLVSFPEPSGWCAGALLDVAGCAVCASAAPSSWCTGVVLVVARVI